MNYEVVPISTHRLMQYTAYLARTLKPQSVRQYLNFVALIHKEYSLPNPLLDNWHLHSLLKGISRVKGCQTKPKQPMTISILLRLYRLLNLHSSLHCSFWAICLVGFFGMFRKSHMVSTSSLSFDSSKQFTKEDFQFFSDHVRIRVRWSKVIQFHQRVLFIPLTTIPGSPLCPVYAIQQAFRLTASDSIKSPAFSWRHPSFSRSTPFTYGKFMLLFRGFLDQLGLCTSSYGSHSLRRGGASLALQAGVPIDTIKLMGDWHSDAVFLYLFMPTNLRLSAQRHLTSHLLLHYPFGFGEQSH